MGPQGGLTFGLSPDATRTSIDAVMYENFTRERLPSYLSVNDPFFFKQGSTGNKTHFIYDEDSGIPNFVFTAEQEDLKNESTRIANRTVVASRKYTKQVPISDEAFRADQVGKREQIGRQVGLAARRTADREGIVRTYGDVAAGTFYTTPDAVITASNTHTTLRGDTVDNLETGALTPDNMWTANNSLAQQLGQNGETEGHLLRGVVVPHTLYKTLKEVMGSPLIANSAENNLNIFETDYGQVMLRESPFLNSAENLAANANTTYTLLGEDHQITSKVFYDLTTYMKSPQETTNDTYVHISKYHRVEFPGTWTALVASIGTT